MAANDDFDAGWGDDPFAGDIDFDMDFDSPNKKGFLRSFATGFLNGIVNKTVGDTDARIDTLKMVLPRTYTGAFSTLAVLNQKRREVLDEIKGGTYESVKDLQYLAQRAATKARKSGSNRIADGFETFSKNDFSDWEQPSSSGSGDYVPNLENTSEEDVAAALADADANSALQREATIGAGEAVVGMLAEVGGRTIGQLNSMNMVSARTNQLLEQIVDYQRRVQTRNDAMKLNIMTRTYLTNAKFYKFSEASNHRMITELKAISKASLMSDYEKTSHSQAMRRSIRESVFNTAKTKFGGIAGFLTDKFGKESRSGFYDGASEVTGALRMAAEMTEGQDINLGDMLGNAAASLFINNLPRLIKTNKAQEYVTKFKRQFPKFAKWADESYARITDLGNVATYGVQNFEGTVNTLRRHYKGDFSLDEADTYEEYVDTLPAGQTPLSKVEWTILNTARKGANKAINGVLDNMNTSQGTRYNLVRRTLDDSQEQSLWSRRNDRTLNEILPQWLSQIHLSIEKFRTGNDDMRAMTYDYVKGKFISHDQKHANTLNAVLDRRQFSNQADMANRLAGDLDSSNTLSVEAKQALAYRLARDTDADQGFSPYNYLKGENDGLDPKIAEEIRELMKREFGITDEHIKDFFDTANPAQMAKSLTYLPTKEGREKAANIASSAATLGQFVPDIANRLDVLKSSGYYDTLKETGIIKNENGYETVDTELLWKTLQAYIKDPKRESTVAPAPDYVPGPNRPFGNGTPPPVPPAPTPPPAPGPAPAPVVNVSPVVKVDFPEIMKVRGMDKLVKGMDLLTKHLDKRGKPKGAPKGGRGKDETPDVLGAIKTNTFELFGIRKDTSHLAAIKEGIDLLGRSYTQGAQTPEIPPTDLKPVVDELDQVKAHLLSLVTLASSRNEVLEKLLSRQPKEAKPLSEGDEKEVEKEKRSIMDRLKQTNFKEMFNTSVDKLLDNQPLILGGLLGGLAGLAVYNPKGAALIAGGAAAATAYGKIRSLTLARRAAASEDLYEEGSDIPILEAAKLRSGDYYDITTKKIIETWDDIRGSLRDLKDASGNAIIAGRKLAGKLFTVDNKEVFLSGLSKIREGLIKAFKWIDPMTRLTGIKNKLVNRFFQMDVYKEGADSPTLVGKRFAAGEYWKKTQSGEVEQLNGWNDIDGPVYDREGNILITQEEYDLGLRTSMGVSVNKLQKATGTAARFGLDFLRKVKDKASPFAKTAANKTVAAFKADYTPIITSVDRIYNLLLKHWGYDPEEQEQALEAVIPPAAPVQVDDPKAPEKAPEEVKQPVKDEVPVIPPKADGTVKDKIQKAREAIAEKFTGKTKEGRLNSNKDKAEKAEHKKDETVKDSIIHIAQNFGYGEKKGEEKKKSSGIFGMLLSGIGMIGKGMWGLTTFFTRTIFGGLTNLFSFAKIGSKILPALGTGIAAIANGIMTLIKTRSLTQGLGDAVDTVRKKRKPRTREGARSPRTRAKLGGKLLGTGMVVSMASDALVNSGVVEDGSVADKALGAVETATTVAGAYQLAVGGAAALGVDISLGAGVAAAGAGVTAMSGWATAAAVAAAPLLFNPFTLAAIGITAAAYGTYRYITRGKGKQLELRMVQYGVGDVDTDLAKKLLKAEEMLTPFVVIGNGRASFSERAPIKEVMQLFVSDPKNNKELGEVFTWFNGRVKPVLLTYMACLDVVKIKSLKEYDEAQSQDVYKVAKQASDGLNGVMPYPYSIVAKVDPDTPLLGEKGTKIRVMNLLEELKKYIDRKTDSKDLQAVDTLTFKNAEGLQKEKAQLQAKLDNPSSFGRGTQRIEGMDAARSRLGKIDEEIKRLNTTYKVGETVSQVFVGDLLPENRAMDLLTAIRVACYGNDEDFAWRVEAVLKLERYSEQFFQVSGDDVKFTGQIGDLFNLFKDSFRVDKDQADDWCLWFRDRFLPVMMAYVKGCNTYRKGRPGVVWRTLSATARYEIAKSLIEAKTKFLLMDHPIWNVMVSPFGKGTMSPAKGDKVDRMLRLLGEAATTAKLKDPEGEAGKTNATTWAKTIAPHKVGGGFTPEAANTQTVDQAKSRREIGLGGQFSTAGGGSGNTYGPSGVYMTPTNKYGFTPLKGDSDTSHLDMRGVQQQAGNDKGVAVPKKLAQQILIREMLKAGFTDPRAIAEVLALTDYESGGYSKTTENMKYSSPAQLVKMFKEVRDMNQARQLVEQGEVAIANTVYGGGKGASLGNMQPGDGWRFRGRGFTQLTGRANYARIGKQLGIDLENHPELASNDPNVMAQVAVQFFKNSKQMQSITQSGNFGEAAKGLNGGNDLPGMPQRYQLYLQYLDQLQKGTLGADGSTDGSTAPEASGQTAGGMYGKPAANEPVPGAVLPSGGSGGGGGSAPTPMMGSPNMPSLISSPTGGQVGGYGTAPNGGEDQPGTSLVGNGATGSGGLRLKSQEAVAGGRSHPGIERLAQIIQQQVQNFRYFSALNDAYHHSKPGNSKHKTGLAVDFTLTNGIAGSDAAVAQVTNILRQAGLTPADFMVINEYRTKTANGTGGHVHTHFKSPESAQKFLDAAGGNQVNNQDTTTGEGPVSAQDPAPNRAQPSVPPMGGEDQGEDDGQEAPAANTPATGGGQRPTATGPSNSPGPQQPEQAPAPNAPPQGNNAPKATPVERAPVPAPAGDNSELVAAMMKMAEALQTTGGAQAVLLKQAVEQLEQLNKKGAPAPASVKLN